MGLQEKRALKIFQDDEGGFYYATSAYSFNSGV